MHGNREISYLAASEVMERSASGRRGAEADEARQEKSDLFIIALKPTNKPGRLGAELVGVSLGRQTLERNPLRELRVWTAEHLTADLSVPALAQRVGMSPRNFQRGFTSGAGKSPARYVEELRIETARRLLERTTQSMDEIADYCGFGSADVLARAFTRVLQLTPGEYRSRFRSSGIGK